MHSPPWAISQSKRAANRPSCYRCDSMRAETLHWGTQVGGREQLVCKRCANFTAMQYWLERLAPEATGRLTLQAALNEAYARLARAVSPGLPCPQGGLPPGCTPDKCMLCRQATALFLIDSLGEGRRPICRCCWLLGRCRLLTRYIADEWEGWEEMDRMIHGALANSRRCGDQTNTCLRMIGDDSVERLVLHPLCHPDGGPVAGPWRLVPLRTERTAEEWHSEHLSPRTPREALGWP